MKPISFKTWCRERGYTLKSWQREAANALLTVMYDHRGTATGKSTLIKLLADFVDEHGNNFEVPRG